MERRLIYSKVIGRLFSDRLVKSRIFFVRSKCQLVLYLSNLQNYTNEMNEQLKSILRVVKLALKSYGRREKRKLLISLLAQIFLSLADLFGVLILGVLSARILNEYLGTSRSKVGALADIERIFHLEDFKAIEIAALVVSIFLVKTVASLILSWRLYVLLAKCANSTSDSFLDSFLETPFVWVRKLDNQKLPFAFMEGINAFSIGVVANTILLCADFAMITILLLGLAKLNLLATIIVTTLFGLLTYSLMLFITPKIKNLASLGTVLSIQGRNTILDIKELFQEFPDRNKSKYFEVKARKIRSQSSINYAREGWFSGLPKNLMETAGIFGIFFILLFASILGPTEANVGLVTAFLAATSRIIPALLRIQGNWLSINRNLGYADEALPVLMRILDTTRVRSRFKMEGDEGIEGTQITGQLAFRDVSFRYPDSETNTLDEISFTVKTGDKIAILGDSGSGKTTLSNLILGLLNPSSGSIEYGRTVSSISNQFLSDTGYLPQRPYIFSGSILENVCLTDDESLIDTKRLAEALRQSKINQFIYNLPAGIHTTVGYGGILLSGGESQRIALSRVLYLNPPIIVLDEPTSSLDAETDDFVSKILTSKNLRNTVFLVAHKYSTVRDVDKIIYLEGGRIIGYGNWSEMMEKVPRFALQAKLQGVE